MVEQQQLETNKNINILITHRSKLYNYRIIIKNSVAKKTKNKQTSSTKYLPFDFTFWQCTYSSNKIIKRKKE
jgi:hypothetical protein